MLRRQVKNTGIVFLRLLGESTFARHAVAVVQKVRGNYRCLHGYGVQYWLGNCLRGAVNQHVLGNCCVRGNRKPR